MLVLSPKCEAAASRNRRSNHTRDRYRASRRHKRRRECRRPVAENEARRTSARTKPKHDTLTLHTNDTPATSTPPSQPPVPRRFRDASRTPRWADDERSRTDRPHTELFASVADRFPDASRCSISRSSQAWDQASPKAGPGLSEVKLEAN